VELQNGNAPSGTGLVYRKPDNSDCIPEIQTGDIGISYALAARIANHNAVVGCGGTDDQTASEVPATPHGSILGTTVQDQLEELAQTVDFGRVWYVSRASGNNATGQIGDYFSPFRDPWFLNDSIVSGDLVYILDGRFQINLGSNAATLDNSVAGVNPELGRNGVTYYWSPGTGIQHVGLCALNTAFFRIGVRSGLGFVSFDYPVGLPDYRLTILGNGSFKNAPLFLHALKGNDLQPGDLLPYPDHFVKIQCDTIQNSGAAIEFFGGSIELIGDVSVMDMEDPCNVGGRGVVQFGSFGSQSAFFVDSIFCSLNVGILKLSRSGNGNTIFPIFGNSGGGGASKKFAKHDLVMNIDNLITDSTAINGLFVNYVSGTVGDGLNVSVSAKKANIGQSSLSNLVNIDGVIQGNISINIDNGDIGTNLYLDDGGLTTAENLNIYFDGNYKLRKQGFIFNGAGRTTGRKIIARGTYDCDQQLFNSTVTTAQNPSQFYFTGLAFGVDSTLFETQKDIYYLGNSFSSLPLFKSTASANIFTQALPDIADFDGAVQSIDGQKWDSETFTATAAQVDFTVTPGKLPPSAANLRVYDDTGAKLRLTDHYTYVASTGVVTLVTPATAGEKYTIEYFQ
jgi:hypothetical protein